MQLDKNKQYGIICYSRKTNPVILAIQLKGQQTLKNYGIKKELHEIPTHSAMLVNIRGIWWVYQSHWKEGVHKVTWDTFQLEKTSDFIIYEDNFNLELMQEKLGEKYARFDILGFLNDFIIDKFVKNYKSFLHKIDKGLFCSEYVALCQRGEGIAVFLGLKCSIIEPCLHWYWAVSMGKVTE